MPELTFLKYGILILTAFASGLVDSIAGGGGILTVPVMLALGIPPHTTLATNKFQSSFGSLTAAMQYSIKGLVDSGSVWLGIVFTAIGSTLGTVTVNFVNAEFLRYFIPVLLAVLFFYFLFSPDLGRHDCIPRLSPSVFYLLFGLVLGFYDGFFGPGVGSMWPVAFVLLLGQNLKRATGHTKVMNFTSNILSLLTFFMFGLVHLKTGLCMGLGQIIGARIGAGLVIRHDVRFIRFFFLTVVALTILRLIYSTYF